MEYDLSFPTISLILAYVVACYCVDQCITPPNPAPSANKEYSGDTMQIVHKLQYIKPVAYVLWLTLFCLLIFPHNRSSFCLNPDLLNEEFLYWNKTNVIYLVVVYMAAISRMAAYAQLGPNFTYRLATPSGLIKTGFYAYVQHPSYTALLTIASANGFYMLRFDSPLACVLPRSIVMAPWQPMIGIALTGFSILCLYFRVRDEETMMRREFGAEWEEWNSKTKKFIPYLI